MIAFKTQLSLKNDYKFHIIIKKRQGDTDKTFLTNIGYSNNLYVNVVVNNMKNKPE